MLNKTKIGALVGGALSLIALSSVHAQDRAGRGEPGPGGGDRGAAQGDRGPGPGDRGPGAGGRGPADQPPSRADRNPAGDRGAAQPPGERYQGPHGYQRPQEPQGWNNRPHTFDRQTYRHNFEAPRRFHVGPYHAPPGWSYRRWGYGQILPRAYWAPEYYLSDYWLFGLEVPPGGYEWVRNGDDALLVDLNTGEILQVEYDVFV